MKIRRPGQQGPSYLYTRFYSCLLLLRLCFFIPFLVLSACTTMPPQSTTRNISSLQTGPKESEQERLERQEKSQVTRGDAISNLIRNSISTMDEESNEQEKEKERMAEEENDLHPDQIKLDNSSLFSSIKDKEGSSQTPQFLTGIFDPTPEQEQLVKFWLHYFTLRDKERFLKHYQNGLKYRPLVENILREYNLPTDLFYLGLIESGYNLVIKSRASAVGPWQFIRGTGKRYGLAIDQYVDERRNIFKSTHAAARYLKDLYNIFHDWALALSAYNAGENKVLSSIRKGKTRKYSELSLKRLLPRETRYYVPKLVAVKTILENREFFGIPDPGEEDKIIPLENHSFFNLEFNTTLDKLAELTKIPQDLIVDLNPDIKGRLIPASSIKPFRIYLPTPYLDSLSKLDSETLKSIKVTSLQWRKLGKSSSNRSVVQKGRKKSFKKSAGMANSDSNKKKLKRYIVKKGDSLFKIALKFNVSVKELKAVNALESKRIFPNQKIYIPM